MKRRNIAIDEELYNRAKAAAALEKIKIGMVLENALRSYFGDDVEGEGKVDILGKPFQPQESPRWFTSETEIEKK